jgi:hypothetical protein
LTGWLQLPTCDEVEFWKAPEKTGWLYSQGEVIKTWRRRWFVLKEGWLFRFAESDVKPSSKPRGVVDMTLVTNVIDGREATGKPNSIKLTTSTGGQVSTTLRISCRAPGDFAGY